MTKGGLARRQWFRVCMTLLLGALTLVLTPLSQTRAQPDGVACTPPKADLILVLDDSGSMSRTDPEHNDPENLRITAAHLMIDLLDPSDRAGLVLFSDRMREEVPLQPLDQVRHQIHESVNRFRSEGGTRLDRALERAVAQLAGSRDRRKAILFLTDGRPDTDPARQVENLRHLASRIKGEGIHLFVIGLGPSYDPGLLDEITSLASAPQAWHVQGPQDLGDVYLQILDKVKDLNTKNVNDGRVSVVGLSGDVRFAAIRTLRAPETEVRWDNGVFGHRTSPSNLPEGVAHTYDILVYRPKEPRSGEGLTKATPLWKIEGQAAKARVTKPALREEVPSGESVTMELAVTPCAGQLPGDMKAEVEVLDADRRPTGHRAVLLPDPSQPGSLQGQVPMPKGSGAYVLQARLETSDGLQLAVADHTVSAAPQSRWELEPPERLASGADGIVHVRHFRSGEATNASVPELQADLPNGSRTTIPLQPGAQTGEWRGIVQAPPYPPGKIRFTLVGTGKTADTQVDELRLRLQDSGMVKWPFLTGLRGQAVPVALTGITNGKVASADRLPPFAAATSVALQHNPWQQADQSQLLFRVEGHLRLLEGVRPVWYNLLDLFVGRNWEWELQPAPPGRYIAADALRMRGRVEPLIYWYYLIPILLLVCALYLLGNWLLSRGPQLRLRLGAGQGPLVDLLAQRPPALTRLICPITQRSITVGGSESGATVILPELPPQARLRVDAKGYPRRENFKITNLSPHVPLQVGGLRQSPVTIPHTGKKEPITVGNVLLRVVVGYHGHRKSAA